MRLADILGHAKPLGIINAYIESSSFSGSFIFSGPEGIGKKMVAQFAAQRLNCTEQNNRPCGSCESCRKIEKLEHPDLHIIQNGQAQIKIDDIRGIEREANFRPYEGTMKVFIIDNAHNLNIEAANSLLKTLEEPPKDALIILITHKPQSIIKTILSRCKQVRFYPLARDELATVLIKNYSLDKLTAHFLGYYAEGRLGLALKLKDSLHLANKNKVFDSFVLSSKPLERNLMESNKEELHACLNILASCFRDIYLLKAGMADNEIIHLDRKDDLLRLIPKYSFRQLDDIMAAISESSLYLQRNINNKLLLHNLGAICRMA